MPKVRPPFVPVKPAPVEDIIEDLHGVDTDLRKIAGTLEVAHDRGLDGRDLLQTVADWLYQIAEEVELTGVDLRTHRRPRAVSAN
jgi:hypothetical protein